MTDKQNGSYPEPLKSSGALDNLTHEDTTPLLGREFINVNIVNDLLNATESDSLIRDLAITSTSPTFSTVSALSNTRLVSERGVVFFRAQHNLTNELQKQLVNQLGLLSGKPRTSKLHIHPVLNNTSEFGIGDAEISHISSEARKKMFRHEAAVRNKSQRYDSAQWHSDIQFEPVPADYTSLRLTQLPLSGGDTLWASGYEIYDRFSPAYQKFFEGLTATFIGDGFIKAAEADPEHVKLYEEERGSPYNVGRELKAVHPVVRTNPVTGWKSIYALGPFPKYINELTSDESDDLLRKFKNMVMENHDLQVRFKWRNPDDIGK
jgi:alpha-ketoglutarate-dependent taurine dioxygenase